MPGGDGTGPAGMGPMTGRGAGYCVGYSVPGYMAPILGRGFWGWRRGGGWGRRNRFYDTGLTGWRRAAGYPPFVGVAPYAAPYGAPVGPVATGQQEVDFLRGQAEYFESALDQIKKRIEELDRSDQTADVRPS